jgi:pilus assembly protein CpaC
MIAAAIEVVALAQAPAADLDHALVSESHTTGMRVISSDQTARFVPLGLSKSVVVDLPRDIRDVLVANPSIVTAVVRSNRRVYMIGAALGQDQRLFL